MRLHNSYVYEEPIKGTSESAEWIFLATSLGLEMLSAAFDQASSPTKPHYALFGVLLATAALLISIWELIYNGRKERVVLRRWGRLWWFYYPPPRNALFGTLPDIYGLVGGISQCICSVVQYIVKEVVPHECLDLPHWMEAQPGLDHQPWLINVIKKEGSWTWLTEVCILTIQNRSLHHLKFSSEVHQQNVVPKL
ncbi:PREDICTED: uncharacterized protein LOC103325585 isoform X2 [Prunus mume]|uniref:Uncharacterized protein LOC103325585 isoform X2 n=1 Tax=Prunus mume TaxID=102107 RepID=A0ABM1LLY6_PRUMU|nr:PREDICTED: uncharacterized protein LOC103325585 isoform X2 [Prunus mume]